MSIVVNLFAPPSSGKSTMASGLFYRLKSKNINCELTGEAAKDYVWEGRMGVLEDQIYLFAKQQRRVSRLVDNVDVVISDSPTIMGLVYAKLYAVTDYPDALGDLMKWQFDQYDNLNFFLQRTKPYHQEGRVQTEAESNMLGGQIQDLMAQYDIPYITVSGDQAGLDEVESLVLKKLWSNQKS